MVTFFLEEVFVIGDDCYERGVDDGVGEGRVRVVGVESVEEGVEPAEADGVHAFGFAGDVIFVDLGEEELSREGGTLREWSSADSSLEKMFMSACATESMLSLLSELDSISMINLK